MFSLTLREQFMVAGLLCTLVTGVAVKHWRDSRRETMSAVVTLSGADVVRPSSAPELK